MPAEAELLCDYYMASHLKGAKKSPSNSLSTAMSKLNSNLSDSMSSLASSSSSLTSETIDFVKYDKNPMDYLKTKYPVLNSTSANSHTTISSTTNGVNNKSAINNNNNNNKPKSDDKNSNSMQIETNWSKIKKTGVGLLNIGNNCYLNATLQCLAYTPPLSQWLVSRPHSQTCRFKQLKGFCSLCEVERIIYDIFNSCNGSVKPNSLCFNIKKISNVFGVGRQEDASEFFTTLLESMNKAMNFLSSATNGKQMNHLNAKSNSKQTAATRQKSILDEIFSFQFRSRVTCCNCGRLSDTIENTNTWPVDVKYVKDLQKGMLHFLREEVLDGENAYKCDKCNKKTRATKKYSIRTAPNVLVVHLKRFDFSHAGKLSHFVTYPETLSLKTLVADLPILNSAASANANNDIKLLKNTSYKLYGVLVHLGYTCKSGHYYSYVRGPNNAWYKADDTRVCSVQEKDALGQNAYILFYKRMTPNLNSAANDLTNITNTISNNTHSNNILQSVQISRPILDNNTNHNKSIIKPVHIETNNTNNVKPTTSTSEQIASTATSIIKSIETSLTNNNTNNNHNTTVATEATKKIDLNEKILKKERLITKLSKKLKKKELKRLRKKLTKLEEKKAASTQTSTNESSSVRQIFLKKKRELRLIRKLISKRKVKRLSNGDLKSTKLENDNDNTLKPVVCKPVASAPLNGTDNHVNGHVDGKKTEADSKKFDLSELETNKTNLIKTWNNEESSLLKNEKNHFDDLSEQELDEYNEEFDKPKIKVKKLKIKNGFHKATHHQNGSNGNLKNNKPFKSFKKQNGHNNHHNSNNNKNHHKHNNQNGSYSYNNGYNHK